MCVTSHTIHLFNRDGDYDEAFAVFDGDTSDIDNYERAISTAKEAEHITAIPSTPCFEYWVWLHFEYSTKPFLGIKNAKSAGTQILSELRKCPGMSNYAKGHELNYSAFVGHLDKAIKHADRAEIQADSIGERNPSTKVHHLIRAIRNEADSENQK